MKRLAEITFMVLLVAVALPAGSQGDANDIAVSGNVLLSTCEKVTDFNDTSVTYFHKGLCVGYVNGVTDGIEMAESLTHHFSYCRPNTATNGQVFDLVVKFVKDHPEVRHWQTRELIIRSMGEAFPCQTVRKPK